MLYPYAYLPFLGVALLMAENGCNMDYVFGGGIVFGIFVHILAFVTGVYNSVITAQGRYTADTAAKMNLITKLVQIPAYLLHFTLGCMAFFMSVWGIGILLFVLAADLFAISFTGISAIGVSVLLYKQGICTKKTAILGGICSFVFIADIVVAIWYVLCGQTRSGRVAGE